MIPKLIYPDSFDFGMPAASLIGAFSGGLDRTPLRKRAALFDDCLKDFKPREGYAYIHLITTGAGEIYSSNSNGDYFNKEARLFRPFLKQAAPFMLDGGLEKYHNKTYESNGAVYRSHNNSHKNGKPSGYIVKAAYNKDMNRGELLVGVDAEIWDKDLEKLANDQPVYFSMACFTAGHEITMADGDVKDIENIVPGDLVVTHSGAISEVTACSCRQVHNDELLEITLDCGRLLKCTLNHPFWTYANGSYDWTHAGCLTEGSKVRMPDDPRGFAIVTLLEKIPSDAAFVFNFEVRHPDHSYLSNGVAVHNCDVPYDICSMCGNKAKTLATYCNHLKEDMGAITKEGFQVYAINDKPLFHDISGVFKPADKIAFALRKVASGKVISSAELALIEGMTPRLDMLRKYSSLPETDRYKLLAKLARMEKEIIAVPAEGDAIMTPFCGKDGSCDEFPEDKVAKLEGESLPDALGGMKQRMIMMPLETFMKLIMGRDHGEIKDRIPAVKDALPGVFGRMLEDPDNEEALEDGSYEAGTGPRCNQCADMVGDLMGSNSLAEGPVHERVMRITIGKPADKSLKISKKAAAEPDQIDRHLAREYAKYALSFAEGMPENIQKLAVAQVLANACTLN